MLWRLRRDNQRWRIYDQVMVAENRWRAQRYGFDEGLIDFGKGKIVPYAELFEELVELIREDAEYFDCVAEVLFHGEATLIVLIGPAVIANGADINEAHLERIFRQRWR